MYRYWVHTFEGDYSAQHIEDTINRYAIQGWRLISTTSYGGKLYLFFERQA